MEEEKHRNNNSNEYENIEPIPEERHFDIKIVDCIQEDSNMPSDSEEINQSEIADLVDEDQNLEEEKSEENLIVADEDSILEKFLTKRSPKKFNQPLAFSGKKNTTKIDTSIKDDLSQILKSEYNVDSVAANLSNDDNTERPQHYIMKHQEADELLGETPKRWLIPISKIIVCASGFGVDTKEKIKESVTKLGGTFNYDFTSNVTVLITMDNHSSKYKAARESNIQTVTAKWLKDSIAQDYFLNPENYLFPLFYECKFHFYDCETKTLVDEVRNYRAEVVIDIDSSMVQHLFIVIPNNNVEEYVKELRMEYSFFSNAFDQKLLTLVTVPWIDAYIHKKYTDVALYEVNPEEYEIKTEELPNSFPVRVEERFVENNKTSIAETKILQKFIKKQEQDIEEHIDKLRTDPDFRKGFFLMDANISLHNVHDKDEKVLINRLINVCGAFLYESFIPGMTTHIITQYPDKELIGKAGSLDNTTGPFVVTKQWLIDSILAGKREDEKYYLPINIENITSTCTIQKNVMVKQKSTGLFGTLFKAVVFSIVTDSYSEIEVEEITEKIESNGGSVVSEYIENSVAKYLIMNDGHSDWKGFALDKNDEGKYIVSHRFLDR